MADLLWPGDHRAGGIFSDRSFVDAMVRFERAWLAGLVDAGIAPAAAAALGSGDEGDEDPWLVRDDEIGELAAAGEAAGNPAVPLAAMLRARLPEPASTWVHRGLTSQDVMDSALMLCSADALDAIVEHLARQVARMTEFVAAHRNTPMLARTLTQPAIATTLGMHAASWLTALLDAADGLTSARTGLRIQVGGAAGTLAAVVELARGRGLADPAAIALRASDALARNLGLMSSVPWHTARGPITTLGDALVGCTDAWGRIARDVLTGSRAEIAELREDVAIGRGGSSTMPGKRNPVLSVLLHRAALAAPALAAALHVAAASANDDRPDGSWHAEWAPLRTLARRTVTAADQATELLSGLSADATRMAENLAAASGIGAEQRSMAALTGSRPAETYRGATDLLIDRVLGRARCFVADEKRSRHKDSRQEDVQR